MALPANTPRRAASRDIAAAPAVLGVVDIGASAIRRSSPSTARRAPRGARRSLARGAPRPRHVLERPHRLAHDGRRRPRAGGVPPPDGRLRRDHACARWRPAPCARPRNAETFLDRVRVRTGLEVEVIDGSEESRLTYIAVSERSAITRRSSRLRPARRGRRRQRGSHTSLAWPAGTGGRVSARLDPAAPAARQLARLARAARSGCSRHTSATSSATSSTRSRRRPRFVIALGGDMRFVASQVAGGDARRRSPRCRATRSWRSSTSRREPTRTSWWTATSLSPVAAETLVPAHARLPRAARADRRATIVVPDVSLRDGLLLDLAAAAGQPGRLRAAGAGQRGGARRAVPVRRAARRRGGPARDAAVRRARRRARPRPARPAPARGGGAAARHRPVRQPARPPQALACTCCRRRRSSACRATTCRSSATSRATTAAGCRRSRHPEYMRLDRDERVRVNKLAAMLRLANALDAEHEQKVKDVTSRPSRTRAGSWSSRARRSHDGAAGRALARRHARRRVRPAGGVPRRGSRGMSREAQPRPEPGSLLQPRAVLAGVQRARARRGAGRVESAARARAVRDDRRVEPRRVLHGARGGAEDGDRGRRHAARLRRADARAHSSPRSPRARTSRSSACTTLVTTMLLPALAQAGIRVARRRRARCRRARSGGRRYFAAEVLPALTPLAIDVERPFPMLSSLSLNLAFWLAPAAGEAGRRLAVVQVPSGLPRLVRLAGAEAPTFVWLDTSSGPSRGAVPGPGPCSSPPASGCCATPSWSSTTKAASRFSKRSSSRCASGAAATPCGSRSSAPRARGCRSISRD